MEHTKGAAILLLSFVFWTVNNERAVANEWKDDSTTAQEGIPAGTYWLTADFGRGFFVNSASGWSPKSSVRIGFGYGSRQDLMYAAHFDFILNGLGAEDWLSTLRPTSAKRYDLALYGGPILLKIVEVGLGVYYSRADHVTRIYNGSPTGTWGASDKTTFRVFYTIGIGYQPTFFDCVMVPFGLYLRNSAEGDNGPPIFLRVGLGYRF